MGQGNRFAREHQGEARRRRRFIGMLAACLCGTSAMACTSSPPPPPPPDPQAEQDRECIQRFIQPRLPTLQDVGMVYPVLLNPRDGQGRPIFFAARPDGRPYCYVEPGLIPGVPLPAPALTPPGIPPNRSEVPCPPEMNDARWRNCMEGRVVTNEVRCPCACFAQPAMAPPSVLPLPCPPTGW